MITAETIYEKAKQLDSNTLQVVADFVDFVAGKRSKQQQFAEMRRYFPAGKLETSVEKPAYTTKKLTIEEMDQAVEYEAGLRK